LLLWLTVLNQPIIETLPDLTLQGGQAAVDHLQECLKAPD
jgi:hypothetical protein